VTTVSSRKGDDPLDGQIREGVGLLGSPASRFSRSVDRDGRFDHLRTGTSSAAGLPRRTGTTFGLIRYFPLRPWLGFLSGHGTGLGRFDLYGRVANVPTAAPLRSAGQRVEADALSEHAVGTFANRVKIEGGQSSP